MPVSCSWILPANCLGFLFIVMRMAFLEDVICANHIVQAVLMMSKPSVHSEFQALVLLRLMHMGHPPPRGGASVPGARGRCAPTTRQEGASRRQPRSGAWALGGSGLGAWERSMNSGCSSRTPGDSSLSLTYWDR